MDAARDEKRRLLDQFIKNLNSPTFDTATAEQIQEFYHRYAGMLKMSEQGLNEQIQRHWHRRPGRVMHLYIRPELAPAPNDQEVRAYLQFINTAEFRDMTSAEKQNYLEIAMKMYGLDKARLILLINEIRTTGAQSSPRASRPLSPVRSRSPGGSRRLSPVNNRRQSPPAPVDTEERVDRLAAEVELTDLLKTVVDLARREFDHFGPEGAMFNKLNRVAEGIRTQAMLIINANIPMRLNKYLELTDIMRAAINDIIRETRELGRRCLNENSPLSQEPISELPDGQYIRMSNGICWDIEDLLDYIRDMNGQNDSTKLKTYRGVSQRIWENEQDLNRILNHPVAVRTGFRQWLLGMDQASAVAAISNETLNRLARAGSLALGRGDEFDRVVAMELTPAQLAVFRREAGGDTDNIDRIRNRTMRADIETTIKQTMKSASIIDMYNYYMSLSEVEKRALAFFEREFAGALTKCRNGEYCQLGMGDMMVTLRNQIARLKGMPPIVYDRDFNAP